MTITSQVNKHGTEGLYFLSGSAFSSSLRLARFQSIKLTKWNEKNDEIHTLSAAIRSCHK
jgi:hypothetical protein